MRPIQTIAGKKAKNNITTKAIPNIKVWINIMPRNIFISIGAFDKYKVTRPPNKHNKLKQALIEVNNSSIDL